MATKKNIKKVNKGGETFVSLQIAKNLDGESMEKKLQLLYKLQKTDSKIDDIYMLRGELPLEVQDLEDEIIGIKTKITALGQDLKEKEQYIADKKNEIVDIRASIKKYEQQRNNVKNNREFDSLSKEIEYKELESQHADKLITEATKSLVAIKENLESQKQELKFREEDLVAKKKELSKIAKETEKEEEALKKEAKVYHGQIDERMLAAYEKVRSNARNKLAVVTVIRGACGGCFNKITPQREIDIQESKKIIVCEYCGRILVSDKFEEAEN